jgi:hypothetical protein
MKTQKKFHTIATQSYRKNLITSLKSDNETYITNHDHKANIIWNSYKDRLGQSDSSIMTYDLERLIQRHDLLHLDEPFTLAKIDTIIKEIPIDKAPGPDGFN